MLVVCVKVNGGSVWVILFWLYAVDLYVEIDGKAYVDGYVCYGSDVNLLCDKVIDVVVKNMFEGEFWMKDFLKKGLFDGFKSWVIIVKDERWGDDDGYVYLLFMVNDVDNVLMGDDKFMYVYSLMFKWV